MTIISDAMTILLEFYSSQDHRAAPYLLAISSVRLRTLLAWVGLTVQTGSTAATYPTAPALSVFGGA